MQQLPVLTKQQKKTLLDFHKSLKPGETQYLNPADPKHKRFITIMLSAAGRTAKKYPHLHRAIASAKGFPRTPKGKNAKEKVHLVDAGKTAAGKTTVTVWARSSSNNSTKGGNLMVFDSDNKNLLAQGENIAVRSGFVACPTRTATAEPAGKKLSVIYLGHNTEEDGKTRFFSFAANAEVADQGIQVNVLDPRIKISGNTEIHIAVGRNNSIPSNSDYIYIDENEGTNPYLIAPFVGNVGVSGSIDLPSLAISDFSTSIFVNNGNGGTQEVARNSQYTPDAKVVSSFSVGSAPNVLQWNFPYDQLGYQATKSIVYNQTSMGNEIDSFFYFAFNGIPFQGGSVSAPFYVCSVDTPEEPSINCTKIPNLYYWWHCLAKGTRVTLEDGSQVPIEQINETYRVQTGRKGESLAVWATVLGHHSSNPKKNARHEIFQLTTTNGKKIKATENHMVFMTADKCRMISHLTPGDPVMTDEGASTVKTIKAVAADGMFYALALGNLKEKAKKNFPVNLAGYYAGGILCGDQQAMRHHVREAYQDPEYMLPRLKEELHQDYMSAINDQRFKPESKPKPVPTSAADVSIT
ncbi:MAG TPA: Hint domain-containing protein, partial [Pyrinomonadaceae bacterium]|nr:Hint domain-containing protein [Pyrinomonadaceae bacterium]